MDAAILFGSLDASVIQLHVQVGKFSHFNSKFHTETKTKQNERLHTNNPTENYFF